MEDYKKKYEEALGRARTFSQRWQGIEATDSELALQELKEIFPELKESEDGRMIKSLKRLIKAYYNVNFPTPEGFEREDMLAWLEKQTIDISSFPEEQRKYMEKYVNLDKTTLVKLLAERDENIEESLKASTCDECEHPIKQNITWSEEDEKILNEFIESLRYHNGKGYDKQINWLKSIKERMKGV